MLDDGNVICVYDGSFDGLMCCVGMTLKCKEPPAGIRTFDSEEPSLFPVVEIKTDPDLSRSVQHAIRRQLGAQAEQWVWDAYYSSLPERELAILNFLRFCRKKEPGAPAMLGDEEVSALFRASRALHSEVHLLTGFIRFADCGGILASTIRPKNFVLPFLEPHFCARFPNESFIIWDAAHGCALTSSRGRARLMSALDVRFPPKSPEEAQFRALWKQFYDTLEIKPRSNSRCRMSHVPKRYWSCMEELRGEQYPLPVSVRQAVERDELVLPGDDVRSDSSIRTPTQASVENARAALAAAVKNGGPALPSAGPLQPAGGR